MTILDLIFVRVPNRPILRGSLFHASKRISLTHLPNSRIIYFSGPVLLSLFFTAANKIDLRKISCQIAVKNSVKPNAFIGVS